MRYYGAISEMCKNYDEVLRKMDIEDQPIKAYVDTAGDLRDCLCLLDPPTQKYLAEHLLFRLEEQGYECDWCPVLWTLTAIKTEEL